MSIECTRKEREEEREKVDDCSSFEQITLAASTFCATLSSAVAGILNCG
jgi:hypothetical protein